MGYLKSFQSGQKIFSKGFFGRCVGRLENQFRIMFGMNVHDVEVLLSFWVLKWFIEGQERN